jgi:hypothetical protein
MKGEQELNTLTREIITGRKHGQLERALELARHGLEHYPKALSLRTTCGWIYYDLGWRDLKNDHLEKARFWVDCFERLDIPKKDKLIHEKFLRLRNSIGWKIARRFEMLVKQEDCPSGPINEVLLMYKEIAPCMPSNLHSFMLRLATKGHDKISHYLDFVRWWDLRNLQPEDYEPYRPENSERIFPSLVEKVIQALYSEAKKRKDPEESAWIAEFIEKHYRRYPRQEWFPYYLGKLVIWAKRPSEARELLLPIVRSNQKNAWAWAVLAQTYLTDRQYLAIACFCRALLCRAQEEHLVRVRLKLAQLLTASDSLPEAKYEVERVIKVRKHKGWKLPDDLIGITQESWYRSTNGVEDNNALYRQLAPEADEVLFEGIPWMDALVMGYQEARDGRAARSFIGYPSDQVIKETPVKHNNFPLLSDLSTGAPIRIKLEVANENRKVVALETREGANWDLLPTKIGVIDHVNERRGVSHVVLGQQEDCLLYHDNHPEIAACSVGTFVSIRLHSHLKGKRRRKALTAELSEEKPPSTFYQEFEGTFRLPNHCRDRSHSVVDTLPEKAALKPKHFVTNYGFVELSVGQRNGDIYVPPYLVTACHIQDGDTIQGSAICEWNKKRKRPGWRALTISKVDRGLR